jgi:hypothetical protein
MGMVERLRSPGATAIRNAGPPIWQVIVAIVVGGLLDAMVVVASRDVLPLVAYVIPPGLLTFIVSIVDQDGPTIRSALAFVGLEQRRRAASIRLPLTKDAADRWLSTEHPEATPFDRAGILITAGRHTDALATLESVVPSTDVDRVRLIRLRASAGAVVHGDGDLDLDAIRAAAAALPDAERKYHVVSAAWTQAWLDITRKRPWRSRFLAVAREWGPYAIPPRVQAAMLIQQYVGPIACALAGLIVVGVQALG